VQTHPRLFAQFLHELRRCRSELCTPVGAERGSLGSSSLTKPQYTPDKGSEDPLISLPTPNHDSLRLLKAALHTFVADEWVLEGPEDLSGETKAQIGLYISISGQVEGVLDRVSGLLGGMVPNALSSGYHRRLIP
jgi:hypothetical protein